MAHHPLLPLLFSQNKKRMLNVGDLKGNLVKKEISLKPWRAHAKQLTPQLFE